VTASPGTVPRSVAFRRERERSWRILEALVARVEAGGIGSLNAEEIARLPALYRSTLAAASVARSISLDRNSVEYLEALAARAYFCVYAAKRRPWPVVREFLVRGFPDAVRRFAPHVLLAALLFLGGVAAGAALTADDPDRYFSIVPSSLAAGRDPGASEAALREALHSGGERSGGELGTFAAYLFSHNTRVGLLCFGLGFAAGLPVFWLLFTNGMILGAMGALYASRGMGMEFWAWVLPHGTLELTALVLCGAGGLALGQALVFPGRSTRLANLARAGREAGALVAGATVLLLSAGLLEGIFRQRVQDQGIRWFVACAGGIGLLLYLAPVRRRS
jgi:uncharacterized membrane protein SpoIIM required for sporulation